MELKITGKNIKLMPDVRGYVERKLSKLGRHLSNILEFEVEITEEKTKSPEQRFVVQVTIDSNGTLLRGESRGENLLTAVDKVVTTIDRQIERYKGKLYDKGRGNSFVRGKPGEKVGTLPENVVRVKQFRLKQMTVDEAIDRMELLGHDFFLFLLDDAGGLGLLYRRHDGDYGLIQPEME